MRQWLRKLFRRDSTPKEQAAHERRQRERDVSDGLHEAAARVHYLEIQAELQRRKQHSRRSTDQQSEPTS